MIPLRNLAIQLLLRSLLEKREKPLGHVYSERLLQARHNKARSSHVIHSLEISTSKTVKWTFFDVMYSIKSCVHGINLECLINCSKATPIKVTNLSTASKTEHD